jgi:Tfp pilus assembly PilM family ATPase
LSGICELSLLKLISRNLEIDINETMGRLAAYRRGEACTPAAVQVPDGKSAPEDRLHITLQHYFSQVLLEIERYIDAFCMMFQTDTLGPLYVTGGASHLPGLVDYLAQELGISLKILNPFSNLVLPPQERRRLQTSSYLFGVSVGLGLLTRGGLA